MASIDRFNRCRANASAVITRDRNALTPRSRLIGGSRRDYAAQHFSWPLGRLYWLTALWSVVSTLTAWGALQGQAPVLAAPFTNRRRSGDFIRPPSFGERTSECGFSSSSGCLRRTLVSSCWPIGFAVSPLCFRRTAGFSRRVDGAVRLASVDLCSCTRWLRAFVFVAVAAMLIYECMGGYKIGPAGAGIG